MEMHYPPFGFIYNNSRCDYCNKKKQFCREYCTYFFTVYICITFFFFFANMTCNEIIDGKMCTKSTFIVFRFRLESFYYLCNGFVHSKPYAILFRCKSKKSSHFTWIVSLKIEFKFNESRRIIRN